MGKGKRRILALLLCCAMLFLTALPTTCETKAAGSRKPSVRVLTEDEMTELIERDRKADETEGVEVTDTVENVYFPAAFRTRSSGLVYLGKANYHGYKVGIFTVNEETAFCMQHNKFNPETGTDFSENIYENENIRKVLYYGMEGVKPWDGFEDDVHARVLTSLALSYYYYGLPTMSEGDYIFQQGKLRAFLNYCESQAIPSTDLQLSNPDTEAYLTDDRTQQRTEEITFQGDGANSITFTVQDGVTVHNVTRGSEHTGTVSIRGGETFYFSAQPGMTGEWDSGKLTGSMQSFQTVMTIPAGNYQRLGRGRLWTDEKDAVRLGVKWLDRGKIRLKKTDSETGEAVPQGNADGFAGTIYDVFRKADYTEGDTAESASYVTSISVDANGNGESELILLDTYYVIERQAPDGYNKDPVKHEAVLPSGENDPLLVHVDSKEEIIRGDLEIIKVAESEDEEEDTLSPLAGAEFTITSKTTGETCVIQTDEKGVATTVSEEFPRGRLKYDDYLVEETKTLEGYEPIKPFHVQIKEEGIVLKGIYKEDKLISSAIRVVKKDRSTGKVIPRSGAEFELLNEKKEVVEMTTHYPKTEVHKTFRTDETGQFTFPERLKAGTYYLRELKAPEGYVRSEEELEFQVKESADFPEPLLLSFYNDHVKGSIEILKKEEGTKKGIGGAVFEITAAEDIVTPDGTLRMKKGARAGTVTTDKEGKAVLSDLFLGTYEVQEIKQPIGYAKSEEIHKVELNYKDDVTPVVRWGKELSNSPTSIRIQKVDADTKEPLFGAVFQIWNKAMEEGEAGTSVDPKMALVPEFVTDEAGEILVSRLNPGTYRIKEVKAPEGYELEEAVHEVTVSEDGRINGEASFTLRIKNKRLPEAEKEEAVKTGDDAPFLFCAASVLASLALVAVFFRKRKGN